MYSSTNLEWNYHPVHSKRTVRLTMNNYIAKLQVKFNHSDPKKAQHSPYKHTPIIYKAKIQYATDIDDSTPLDTAGILRV